MVAAPAHHTLTLRGRSATKHGEQVFSRAFGSATCPAKRNDNSKAPALPAKTKEDLYISQRFTIFFMN